MSWIAVQGGDPDAVCGELGFVRTGDYGGFLDFPTGGAVTPSGWYVVLFDDVGTALDFDEALTNLSGKSQVVRCYFMETVMHSVVEGWAGGEEAWSVGHDSSEGLDNLDVSGTPPGAFEAIKTAHVAKQQADGDSVDWFFDIPLDLAKAITGYAAEEFEGDDPRRSYEGLEPL